MKTKLIFTYLFFLSFIINSQNNYELSKPFKEPGFWTKLLIMKNGNTLMFHVSDREGIEVTVYDAKHLSKLPKKLNLSLVIQKTQYVDVLGIYEINNQAVLFISQYERPNPTLMRVVVDGTTGERPD